MKQKDRKIFGKRRFCTRRVHVDLCHFPVSQINGYTFLKLFLSDQSLGASKKGNCIYFGPPGILKVVRPKMIYSKEIVIWIKVDTAFQKQQEKRAISVYTIMNFNRQYSKLASFFSFLGKMNILNSRVENYGMYIYKSCNPLNVV